MKTLKLILISMLVVCSSCESDDDGNAQDNTVLIQQLTTTVQSGTWRITNYNDSGQDETSDFAGYDFTFETDGTLTAVNASNTLTGTWSITDDSSDNDVDFNIFFPVPETNDFEDLNDDWDIISNTTTKIELRDVSGGSGEIDLLTFEKN